MKTALMIAALLLCCAFSQAAYIAKPRLDGRIVGGDVITINQWPTIVSMQLRWGNSFSHVCGASIISANRLVSAAHCYDNDYYGTASNWRAIQGSSWHASGGNALQISAIINHPNYDARNIVHDISVLRLSTNLGSNVPHIALPVQGAAYPADGTWVSTAGWGTTSESGSASAQLKAVDNLIWSQARCSSAYSIYGGISDFEICSGWATGGRDACQGDSGGPLVLNGVTLIGVTSWGLGCARPAFPGVYARVSQYTSWVRSQ